MDNHRIFTTDFIAILRELWPKYVLPHLDLSNPIHWLEVGSFEGRSALWTVENMLLHPDSTITCVDPWICWMNYAGHDRFDFEKHFDHNVAGVSKIQKLKGSSADVLPGLPLHAFHGCYIDGLHEEDHVREDALLALPLLKPGAIIVFDDYAWEGHPGVKNAVDTLLQEWGSRIEVILIGYQVICKLTASTQ